MVQIIPCSENTINPAKAQSINSPDLRIHTGMNAKPLILHNLMINIEFPLIGKDFRHRDPKASLLGTGRRQKPKGQQQGNKANCCEHANFDKTIL